MAKSTASRREEVKKQDFGKPQAAKEGSRFIRALRNPRVVLYLFMLFIVMAVASATVLIKLKNQQIPTDPYAECSRDSDCVKVQTTCCSCSYGGDEICTSTSRAEELRAKNCDRNPICTARYACKIKSCSCNKGTCEGVDLQE